MVASTTNNFVELIALFLSEIIRSRQVTIRRAAEIAHLVIIRLPEVVSEADALRVLTDIERDFEEVVSLKQAIHFGYDKSDIRLYEREIREFASQIFMKDMVLSATFLQDAAREGMTIQELCLKYPNFCEYLLKQPEKSALLSELQRAT